MHRLDGPRLPFAGDAFDVLVVVDMLEHVADDRALVEELWRVIRPAGRLIANVPHARNTLLRHVRLALGQTDERHGLVRPGYTAGSLARLLEGRFEVLRHHTYSRIFCETVGTHITAAHGFIKGGGNASSKGVPVTGADMAKHEKLFKLFKLYSLVYPVCWAAARLDRASPFAEGYMLIGEARRISGRRA